MWCEIKIYLFGSHLRFKSLYRILDIKLRKYLVFLQNAPLKLKIKAFKIFIRVMTKFAKIKTKSGYIYEKTGVVKKWNLEKH